MPLYSFKNEETGEIVEILQGMNDEHVFERDGIRWNRVWHNPQISFDTKIDPNSHRQFMDKTSKKGTYGDLMDRAAELSERRAVQNGGIDPLKQKSEEQYSKERGGRKIPKKLSDLDIQIGQ